MEQLFNIINKLRLLIPTAGRKTAGVLARNSYATSVPSVVRIFAQALKRLTCLSDRSEEFAVVSFPSSSVTSVPSV